MRVGTERIAYQARSPLAAEMIGIMEQGRTAFASWYASYPTKTIDKRFLIDGAAAVETAIKDKILASLKKHTGIDATSFEIDTDQYTVISNAWCGTGFKGWDADTYDSYSTVVELGDTYTSDLHTKFMKNRTSMYDMIDLRMGTVHSDLSKYVRWRLGMSLAGFMYPTTGLAFLDKYGLSVTDDVRLADTAEEMAATMLHEIGHAFFMVADGLKLIKASDNLIDTYNEVAIAAIAAPANLPKVVDTMVGNNTSLPAAAARTAAASLEKLADAKVSDTSSVSTIAMVKKALMCATALAVSKSRDGFEAVTSIFLDSDEYRLIRVNIGAMSRKAGELATTGRQRQRAEIIADSFATRHGLGAELAMGLSKFSSVIGMNTAALKTLNESSCASGPKYDKLANASFRPLCALAAMSRAADVPIKRLSSRYPDELDRCRFIVMEHMNFFKSIPRTPRTEEIISQWVVAGRRLDHLYQNVKNDQEIQSIRRLLERFGFENTRGTFGGGLLAGNTHNDYRKLQDTVDELIKSSAYFHAENFMTNPELK